MSLSPPGGDGGGAGIKPRSSPVAAGCCLWLCVPSASPGQGAWHGGVGLVGRELGDGDRVALRDTGPAHSRAGGHETPLSSPCNEPPGPNPGPARGSGSWWSLCWQTLTCCLPRARDWLREGQGCPQEPSTPQCPGAGHRERRALSMELILRWQKQLQVLALLLRCPAWRGQSPGPGK